MARPLRIEFAGALYHVMSRGNERRRIVRDQADYRKRIDWLRRTVETYGWRVSAFVVMPNHDHLLVRTPEPNLSAGMQFLNGSYTGYFNRRHRRVGHLFQGRFKAQLVEQESYLVEVSRYIHLNPVRAKLVDSPQRWPLSSFPGYHQASRALSWVDYRTVLGEFARDEAAARRAYRRFVRAGVEQPPPSPWKDAIGGLILGSEAFLARIRKSLANRSDDAGLPELSRLRERPSLDQIIEVVSSHFGCAATNWCSGKRSNDPGRAVAAYLARRRFGYLATEVARRLGYRGPSGVTRAIARVETADPKLRRTMAKLERRLC
ncbi:MAG: hypothetical protein A2V70_12670 [Planctomycetes bacterium RBG_13_63_9]|nr:MAG: hypothetical protein A2V70_12670 [Planctomycetes bacterium RBG_13_63_9]